SSGASSSHSTWPRAPSRTIVPSGSSRRSSSPARPLHLLAEPGPPFSAAKRRRPFSSSKVLRCVRATRTTSPPLPPLPPSGPPGGMCFPRAKETQPAPPWPATSSTSTSSRKAIERDRTPSARGGARRCAASVRRRDRLDRDALLREVLHAAGHERVEREVA